MGTISKKEQADSQLQSNDGITAVESTVYPWDGQLLSECFRALSALWAGVRIRKWKVGGWVSAADGIYILSAFPADLRADHRFSCLSVRPAATCTQSAEAANGSLVVG